MALWCSKSWALAAGCTRLIGQAGSQAKIFSICAAEVSTQVKIFRWDNLTALPGSSAGPAPRLQNSGLGSLQSCERHCSVLRLLVLLQA